ncbi:hypothetical protein A2239_02380 [Candidatus Uhrbacteria bacterium RIFOXYA2_FULL_40_9]|nr:MAG: hypothetical protein A2239_02380 [Candidatus Uhrbacteria bacterium RIFOXYA2_FULL_40_9]OGL97584.1 MAG: hypothetical protein A2332_01050 [Candidatus Uhrbacteria bacterium RIFOXYB2_FULL_41_18]HBK34828.1 hypothetical protein [Candidatus Uhrbacteria bacterium]HCB56103.1 hypothetical protein [Candidatus Uhrbacteria bacterium]
MTTPVNSLLRGKFICIDRMTFTNMCVIHEVDVTADIDESSCRTRVEPVWIAYLYSPSRGLAVFTCTADGHLQGPMRYLKELQKGRTLYSLHGEDEPLFGESTVFNLRNWGMTPELFTKLALEHAPPEPR